MNRRWLVSALPTCLAVGGILLLAFGVLGAGGTTNERVRLSLASVATPTPMVYITPTPLFGLLGGDVLRATAEAAGTATRSAQLTFVPIWPPGVPREYPTRPPSTPVVIAVPSQVAGSGIIYNADLVGVGVALDLPSQLGIFVNEWDAEINGQYVQVLAGTKSAPAESEQAKGVVVVRISDSHYNILDLATYDPPLARGVVRVVDAIGERLTLQADDGTRFYFDVATRQWVNP